MKQRGDTIVEVLFAVTVFSLVAVGGLSLMNQGAAMAQRSLEIGLVRDQMDAQADALRFMHNAYVANFGQQGSVATDIWNEVTTKHAVTKAQAFSDISDGRTCRLAPSANASSSSSDGAPYALDIRKLDTAGSSPVMTLNQANNIDTTATYSQIRYPLNGSFDPAKPEGIWVQAVSSPSIGGKLGYYDFHIRACWLTPGQLAPVTLGTIVRLYEP
jgi:type II secretory pathway pseudopilin PulG